MEKNPTKKYNFRADERQIKDYQDFAKHNKISFTELILKSLELYVQSNKIVRTENEVVRTKDKTVRTEKVIPEQKEVKKFDMSKLIRR